ncbi:MAG: beta-lactamase family protein [Oscillospiraceae bacterium]|nr:beta-lactamase family protein [Oscillospiraceae bacterium]
MDFSALQSFMDHMTQNRTPGNAIEVYLSGVSVFRYASGYSDLENKIPITGEEMFNIYSCSKVATVTAGAQLLERREFLLKDPLYEYIPEFKEMYIKSNSGALKKAKNLITIGDLFSMTAGFTYNTKTEGFRKASVLTDGKMDTVQTIRCMASDPLSFEPGTHWQYSLCHDVLAAVISVISGKKFRDYMIENYFDPLGMKDTVYHHTEQTLARTAQQYRFITNDGEDQDLVEAQIKGTATAGYFGNEGKSVSFILGEEYDSGGAGIITTVSDYAKLAAALGRGGVGIGGERILSPYTVNLLRINRLGAEQLRDFNWSQLAGCGYGLGVRTHIDPAKSGLICNLGEFGWCGAAGSSEIVDPDIGLGVFYAQHCLNPREEYYLPRLRNLVYACL